MGCVEEGSTVCYVHNKMSCAEVKKIILLVRPSDTIAKLFDDVSRLINYEDYEIVLQTSKDADPINLNDLQGFKTLSAVGFNFEEGSRNTLIIGPLRPNRRKYAMTTSSPMGQDMYNDDDLALGASASPTEQELSTTTTNLPISSSMFECRENQYKSSGKLYSGQRPAIGYVGLVNQAMTCYLNSLLQALFMTPEFRNALYNWEFDGIGESKSIPYQLQKLFLNLQTSPKFAVETTDLTKSFGWDSSEAWQQHDIQELCRVMFDALEQKFKNTKQADLINRLYEGKMMDYVKCLECSTEKSREDTFLDIPLPVRPFGSAAAYESVEEALKAFVQPETLDGNNQYFCEKCNKKCDAHKGLKFTKFPYILTLHLKRFDFDYQTLHRIKLNDKVTFPQTLNLNSFIIGNNELLNDNTNNDITITATTSSSSSTISDNKNIDNLNKFDECSTTDSGSIIEDDSCNSTTINFMQTNSNNVNDLQDEDEGIDMGINSFNKHNHITNNNGPYIYELFSIMIHSGSASGGHYYAYIKDFETCEWYCFNDQNVTMITQEDIQKSFGGGNSKSYYSGAFSSSTNAYMLMYRQLDTVRNCLVIKTDNYPEHITNLLNKLKEKEDKDKKLKESELEMLKLQILLFNPLLHRMQGCKLYITSNTTLEETLEDAYNRLLVNMIAPIERCRLVGYCNSTEFIECSFEGKEKCKMGELMNSLINPNDLLLEIRDEDKEFETYASYGLLTQIYFINLITSEIDKPLIICNQPADTILEYKKYIVKKLKLNNDNILLAMLKFKNEVVHIDDDTSTLLKEQVHPRSKIFIALNTEPDSKIKLQRFVEHYRHIITLYVNLPEINDDTYSKLGIPDTDRIEKLENNEEETIMKSEDLPSTLHIPPPVQNTVFPSTITQIPAQPLTAPVLTENLLRHVNDDAVDSSEDSSLSDGDRTLVESLDDVGNQVNSLYETPDCSEQQINIEIEEDYFDIVTIIKKQKKNYFYNIVKYNEPIWSFYLSPNFDNNDESIKKLKKVKPSVRIIVDKRMLFGQLKYLLEKYIQVPMEYFYINQSNLISSDKDHFNLTEDLSSITDGDSFKIELGRVLKKGEFRCKIYYLKLSEVNEEAEQLDMLFEWVIKTGDNVAEIKKAMVKKYALNAKLDINNIDMNKFRIRKKNTKNPGKIYLDDQFFGDDIALTAYSEFILQELEGDSIIPTDPDDIVLFVRRWSPSTLTLGKFEELLVTKDADFSQLLSNISNIPVENIAYAKLSGSFPRCNLTTVYLNSFLSWSSQPITLNKWPLNISQDGYIYYYRDSTEVLKETTQEDKRELNGKENSRLDNKLGSMYSPRKERALKIYLDSSPKKVEE